MKTYVRFFRILVAGVFFVLGSGHSLLYPAGNEKGWKTVAGKDSKKSVRKSTPRTKALKQIIKGSEHTFHARQRAAERLILEAHIAHVKACGLVMFQKQSKGEDSWCDVSYEEFEKQDPGAEYRLKWFCHDYCPGDCKTRDLRVITDISGKTNISVFYQFNTHKHRAGMYHWRDVVKKFR